MNSDIRTDFKSLKGIVESYRELESQEKFYVNIRTGKAHLIGGSTLRSIKKIPLVGSFLFSFFQSLVQKIFLVGCDLQISERKIQEKRARIVSFLKTEQGVEALAEMQVKLKKLSQKLVSKDQTHPLKSTFSTMHDLFQETFIEMQRVTVIPLPRTDTLPMGRVVEKREEPIGTPKSKLQKQLEKGREAQKAVIVTSPKKTIEKKPDENEKVQKPQKNPNTFQPSAKKYQLVVPFRGQLRRLPLEKRGMYQKNLEIGILSLEKDKQEAFDKFDELHSKYKEAIQKYEELQKKLKEYQKKISENKNSLDKEPPPPPPPPPLPKPLSVTGTQPQKVTSHAPKIEPPKLKKEQEAREQEKENLEQKVSESANEVYALRSSLLDILFPLATKGDKEEEKKLGFRNPYIRYQGPVVDLTKEQLDKFIGKYKTAYEHALMSAIEDLEMLKTCPTSLFQAVDILESLPKELRKDVQKKDLQRIVVAFCEGKILSEEELRAHLGHFLSHLFDPIFKFLSPYIAHKLGSRKYHHLTPLSTKIVKAIEEDIKELELFISRMKKIGDLLKECQNKEKQIHQLRSDLSLLNPLQESRSFQIKQQSLQEKTSELEQSKAQHKTFKEMLERDLQAISIPLFKKFVSLINAEGTLKADLTPILKEILEKDIFRYETQVLSLKLANQMCPHLKKVLESILEGKKTLPRVQDVDMETKVRKPIARRVLEVKDQEKTENASVEIARPLKKRDFRWLQIGSPSKVRPPIDRGLFASGVDEQLERERAHSRTEIMHILTDNEKREEYLEIYTSNYMDILQNLTTGIQSRKTPSVLKTKAQFQLTALTGYDTTDNAQEFKKRFEKHISETAQKAVSNFNASKEVPKIEMLL